jgi:hypothetical protein
MDSSLVYEHFSGQILSQVECRECGHVTGSFEEFLTLHLSFPNHFHSASLL